jgi:hypothetical protein
MAMKTEQTLTGVQRGKGDSIIDGKPQKWDYTRFHLIAELPDDKGNSVGSATQVFQCGLSDEYAKWEKHSYPMTVECEFELGTTGKGMTTMVLKSIKPTAAQPVRVK